MGLYERIIGLEDPKLPVHQFMAALGEFTRGDELQADVVSQFGLDVVAQTDLTNLLPVIVDPGESISVGGFVTLTNVGAAFDSISASQGLGWFEIDTTGIKRIKFAVRVNKIGTGTQTWQLWNQTDSSEITKIDDAGAAGVKQLSIVHTFPSPLTASTKSIRVRAMSTVAADDPVYFGASVGIQRTRRLLSTDLHEIFLLAEGGQKYTTVAELKARLNVP